jgi:hypothetical protein
VRNESDTVFARHPGDSPFLADTTHFRDIRLHNVERARFEPRLERLATSQNFASSNRHARMLSQPDVIGQCVRHRVPLRTT